MPNIQQGYSYFYIKASDLQTLIDLGYTNAAEEFIYTHPTDTTYLYANISSVNTPDEIIALGSYWYPEEEDPTMLDAPVFDYMQSGQIPYPFW